MELVRENIATVVDQAKMRLVDDCHQSVTPAPVLSVSFSILTCDRKAIWNIQLHVPNHRPKSSLPKQTEKKSKQA